METYHKQPATTGKKNLVSRFLSGLSAAIQRLFEPEEVEVTFNVEGKTITYTYKVVEHQHAA